MGLSKTKILKCEKKYHQENSAVAVQTAEPKQHVDHKAGDGVKTDASQDIVLSGVPVITDVFLLVLDYLPRYEVVHSASLVSKAWLSAARKPEFWHTLDSKSGLLRWPSTGKSNTEIADLLSRPQFASLKSLTPPSSWFDDRSSFFECITKVCPTLEEIDFVGYRPWIFLLGMDVDNILLSLPSLFPRLCKVRFPMHIVSMHATETFCKVMGDRLLSIRISDESINPSISYCTLRVMSQSCPKLEHFDYTFERQDNFDVYANGDEVGSILDKGITTLLKGCRELKSLCLICPSYGPDVAAYEYIVEDNSSKLRHLYVVGNPALMNNQPLCDRLEEKLETFKAISISDHRSRKRNRTSSDIPW